MKKVQLKRNANPAYLTIFSKPLSPEKERCNCHGVDLGLAAEAVMEEGASIPLGELARNF